MKIGAGELNQLIDIERLTLEQNEFGSQVEKWVLRCRCWAKIKEGSAKEAVLNDGLGSGVSFVAIIRYRKGIQSSDRIKWNGIILNVVSPIYTSSNDFLTIQCESGVIS